MNQSNPLQKYFRQPAIYIKLPSEGKFYPQDSLNPTPNGELAVYPMTALDEITYRTADALFNGSAVANVIQSCVPDIKDAWAVPSSDLDTLLIGIRIATYGHEMDIDSICPSCEEENTFGIDLRQILDSLQTPDYSETVSYGDMEFYFKPLSYLQQNENSMMQFNDQKLIENITDADVEESEKITLINAAFVKLGEMTMHAISQSIAMIKAGDNIVSEPEYIKDFVKNCDRKAFAVLRNHISKLKETSEIKPINLQCQHCSHQYSMPFTMDVSSFFASDS